MNQYAITYKYGKPTHQLKLKKELYKKTVHNKTTSYLEIRNHVSFKTAFKIENHNKTRELNVQFVGGQKTCDHVM